MEMVYFAPLTLLAIFCLRLLLGADSRRRGLDNLSRGARGWTRPSVQAVSAALFLSAVAATATMVTARFGAEAPDPLTLLRALAIAVTGLAAAAGGCLWIFATPFAALPLREDLRLSDAARRLGLARRGNAQRSLSGHPNLMSSDDKAVPVAEDIRTEDLEGWFTLCCAAQATLMAAYWMLFGERAEWPLWARLYLAAPTVAQAYVALVAWRCPGRRWVLVLVSLNCGGVLALLVPGLVP